MRVLVSNDDGILAQGIQTLVNHLASQYEVYVVAPDRERSATGHALTLHKPIRIDEVEMDVPVAKAYSITGTPSDCVKIALSTLLLDIKPDVVVSGINHGPNLGADVLYSGTVSAAIEGRIFGIPSIAVSLMGGSEKSADFSAAAQFICNYIPRATSVEIPPKTILNVNVPAVPLRDITGVKLTTLGTRMYNDTYEKRLDPRGHVYYWLAGEMIEKGESPDADLEAVRNNMISVSPVKFDMTNYAMMDTLKTHLEMDDLQPGTFAAPDSVADALST